jgi:hypothetical protein
MLLLDAIWLFARVLMPLCVASLAALGLLLAVWLLLT